MRALRGLVLVVACALAAAQPVRAADPPGAGPGLAVPALAETPPFAGLDDGEPWAHAVERSLDWNLRLQRPAPEPTRVELATDGAYLYVRFEARQSAPVIAGQRSDDVGADLDDQVEVILWPGGPNGFQYSFVATPLGTHYQFSSENAVFQPSWLSRGRLTPGGYTVAMRIPLGVMRGAANGSWRMQLVRLVRQTQDTYVWSHGAAQSDPADVVYAGEVRGLGTAAPRPKPRFAPYAVAAAAAPAAGGPTSRAGLDLSLPVARTASVFAALHPDYSNAAADQAVIQQSALRTPILDYRPFFTQAASFYDTFGCLVCQPVTELYTPAIPTFRQGYALEGKGRNLTYAGFDAIGANRVDDGQAVVLRTPDRRWSASLQRIAAELPGLHDATLTGGLSYDDHRHAAAYADYGFERGSAVPDAAQGRRLDAGASWYGPTWYVAGSLQRIGAYYDPVDGFVAHPDIAGYGVGFKRTFEFSSASWFEHVALGGSLDRYHQHDGRLNQSDDFLDLEVVARSSLRLHLTTGADYVRLADGALAPAQQNGLALTYRKATALPISLAVNEGRFGPGRLYSFTRLLTLRAGPRGILSLRADDTDQFLDSGPRLTQWLERATFSYQASADASLTLGVRRLIGRAPQLLAPPLAVNAWNVSGGLHERFGYTELDVVYGDASRLATTPQLVVRLVRYIGAEKGV